MNRDITTLIFASNNEDDIADAIISARALSDSITVIDIGSTDKTAAIARTNGASVIKHEPVVYVEPARAAGIKSVKTPWVFILDADERITEDLAKEIQKTIKDTAHTYFKVPRKNIFAKRVWFAHGGWWPDTQMRLIHTHHIKDWPARIHSTPEITGTMGHLNEPFLHFFHGDFTSMTTKTIKYEAIEAELLSKAGRASTTLICMRKFAGELWRRLIRDRGYRDGVIGYLEAVYQAYSKTVTYLFVYELEHKSPAKTHS